jgi:DHA1 family tetracycline resistance protein-like MFS transporter
LATFFGQDAFWNHRCHGTHCQAYVADVTTRNERLRYLGLLGAAAGLVFILGPAVGGTLSNLFGYGVPSFLASALAFTNLVLVFSAA